MSRQAFRIVIVSLLVLTSVFSAAGYTHQFAEETGTVRLQWKNGVIPISISTSLTRPNPNIRPDSNVLEAVRRSLRTWEEAANITFVEVLTAKQTVSPSGKSGDNVNLITIAQTPENLVLFGEGGEESAARTRVFFDGKGEITEGDIVLNPYEQFSTDGSIGTYDLESALTHELGHLLGLDHSIITGATMQMGQGKNGVYNLPGFSSRSLAEDDITGIRALYGSHTTDELCCGVITGEVTVANGGHADKLQVWLEERESGRLIAGVLTGADGTFSIEGLRAGTYRLNAKNTESNFSAEQLGDVEITKGAETKFSGRILNQKNSFDLLYVGFNGQLSSLAVPVNAGKSYVVYLGGHNLTDNLSIALDSPFIEVTSGSITRHDYGSEISVISFEITLSKSTPVGEYSFIVSKGETDHETSIGSLTVESFLNPWSSFLIMRD